MADAVRFLVESDFITGECLTIDGGERWAHVRSRFLAEEGGTDAQKPPDGTG